MALPDRPDLTYGLLAGSREAFDAIGLALREARGNVTRAALALGVGHRTLARWIAEHPTLAAARDEARDYDQNVIEKPAGNSEPGDVS